VPKKETRYDEAIVIAIESDYKEKLKDLADKREIGFTQLARRAIKDYFEEEISALEDEAE
jgi:predicted transcriptional regulator